MSDTPEGCQCSSGAGEGQVHDSWESCYLDWHSHYMSIQIADLVGVYLSRKVRDDISMPLRHAAEARGVADDVPAMMACPECGAMRERITLAGWDPLTGSPEGVEPRLSCEACDWASQALSEAEAAAYSVAIDLLK